MIKWSPNAIEEQLTSHLLSVGSPGGASGQEPSCQCRRRDEMWAQALGREDPLDAPPPVCSPGEAHRQRGLAGWSQRVGRDRSDLAHTRPLLFVPRNLHKRDVISPSQLLSFSKLPEPTSRAASRAAEVMEASVQEVVRRGHLRSGPSQLPTGERPG